MVNTFIFFILLLFINLIFTFKRVPVIAFPIGLYSFYMSSTIFLNDSNIPYNPHSSVFLILLITCSLLSNALSLKEK